VQPGTETALAQGLARVLLEERLVVAQGPMPPLTLGEAAGKSRLSVEAIRDLARTIVQRPPAVVVASDDNPSLAALNVVLGAVGRRGGIVTRSKPAKPSVAADTGKRSVRAVLIDSTVPWDFAPPTGTEVFRFAAWDGGASHADWLAPSPGFLEELTDVPIAPALAIDTYAIAPSLVKPPGEVRSTVQFLATVDPSLPAVDKIIHARCEDLFRKHVGSLKGPQATPVANIESAQKLEEQMRKGAVWVGDPAPAGGLRGDLKEWPPGGPPPTKDWPEVWAVPVKPPLASKIYQESNLREAAERRIA
jgi:hypothetical protein